MGAGNGPWQKMSDKAAGWVVDGVMRPLRWAEIGITAEEMGVSPVVMCWLIDAQL